MFKTNCRHRVIFQHNPLPTKCELLLVDVR